MKPNIDKISSYATGWIDATNYITEMLKTCYIVIDPGDRHEAREEGYMKVQVDDILARAKKSKGRHQMEKGIINILDNVVGEQAQAKMIIDYIERLNK